VRAYDLCGGAGKAQLFSGVHPNDIAQGILGDCWFLAALAGLAEFEGAIFNLFQDKKVNPEGMYTINIFNATSKMWESVTIDDFIPIKNGEPLMAKPQGHEMWVLLLEKAFAKWFGSYCKQQL
jgi:calpain-15